EYVYGKERQSYGDLGQPLGRALRERISTEATARERMFPSPVLPAPECICATVMGASQYSVQLSGNTIRASYSDTLLRQRSLQGLVQAIPGTLKGGRPVVLVFDQDVAGTVGSFLKEEYQVPNDILSIDGIILRDFDFIDIGRVLEPSGTVPVTIKSLVFQM